MEELIIYNVLVKAVEKCSSYNPYPRAFSNIEDATEYIFTSAEKMGLEIKSSLFLNEEENWDGEIFGDYRLEDEDGNSYYFVIYYQTVKLAHHEENNV